MATNRRLKLQIDTEQITASFERLKAAISQFSAKVKTVMDLSAAINLIQETAKRADIIRTLRIGTDDLILTPGGAHEWRAAITPSRRHETAALASFIAAVKWYDQEDMQPSIWVADGQVVAVMDDLPSDYRRHQIRMPLQLSEPLLQISTLSDLARPPAECRRLLKRKLWKAVDQSVVSILSGVLFSGTDGEQNEHQTLGRQVERQVHSGAGDVPEIITATVPVFSNPDLQVEANVALACDVDFEKRGFAIYPLPGEVDAAIALGLDFVREQLIAAFSDEYVFAGMPESFADDED